MDRPGRAQPIDRSTRRGELERSARSEDLQYAAEAVGPSDRVWLLGSHPWARERGGITRQLRVDLGLELADDDERDGASRRLWTIPGAR